MLALNCQFKFDQYMGYIASQFERLLLKLESTYNQTSVSSDNLFLDMYFEGLESLFH